MGVSTRRVFSSLAWIALTAAFTGCGTNKETSTSSAASAEHVAASSLITESFGTGTDPKTGAPALVLRKDALEKEFLMQSALIEQTVAPMGKSMRSRVVAFKRSGNQLLLVEATAGHTVTNDMPQRLILTSFPLFSEDADTMTFDFNTGMSVIFSSGDWAAHDSSGRDYKPTFNFTKVRVSYLDVVRFAPPNRLEIRQVAQVPVASLLSENVLPVEVRYFFSPYRPNPAFVPAGESDFKRAGFFEVSPRLKLDGSTEIFSTKFDSSKPIRLAISSNTPAQYRQAVRDGILYWKSAMPTLEAIDAPAGLTAPDIDYNIIQWVNHDRAGSAYADAQLDPRTGEVLHAQAYITSTFAFSGRNKVRSLLRRLDEPSKPKASVALAGFELRSLCDLDVQAPLQRSLGELLAVKASDEAILRVSQDYVRAVVAHEVGHILGLRHNFAGSLAAKNYTLEKRDAIFQTYLADDKVPADVETASTEMDYLPMEESAIHGQQMRTQPNKMYPYDRIALEMLYQGKNPAETDVPPFCTDTSVDKYSDCRRHDAGVSLVEFADNSSRKAIKTLANRLLETFISAKAPEPWERVREVNTVSFDPDKVAGNVLSPLDDLMTAFASQKNSLLIARMHPFVGPLNKEFVDKKERDSIQSEVKRLGGWEKVFAIPTVTDYEKILDATEELLRDPTYRSGLGLGGQSYSFSDKEIDDMLNTILNLVVKLPESATKADLAILKKIPDAWKVTGTETGDDLVKLVSKRVNDYVMSTRPTTFLETEIELPTSGLLTAMEEAKPKDDVKPATTAADAVAKPKTKTIRVKLPLFFYSQESREKASKLLAKGTDPEGIDWGFAERAQLKADFKKQLDTACGCDFSATQADKVKVADATKRRAVTRWFLENKSVLSAIPL
jgi:hypothetical protein